MSNYPQGTAARSIEIALGEVGVVEEPENKVKYNNQNGLPWCGYFQDWIAKQNGLKMPSQIGTELGAHKMKEIGRWVSDSPQAGDWVYLGWSGKGKIEHIGLVCKVAKDHVLTIEGNTSDKNQSNGGMVMIKKRAFDEHIIGFARPKYVPYKGDMPVIGEPATIVSGAPKPTKKKGLLKK